jgi:hypothetical protein
MIKLILLNVFILALTCTPLLLFWALRKRSAWVERNHEMLGIGVWLVTLLAVYIWVLPMLGLKPNPRFFNQ